MILSYPVFSYQMLRKIMNICANSIVVYIYYCILYHSVWLSNPGIKTYWYYIKEINTHRYKHIFSFTEWISDLQETIRVGSAGVSWQIHLGHVISCQNPNLTSTQPQVNLIVVWYKYDFAPPPTHSRQNLCLISGEMTW